METLIGIAVMAAIVALAALYVYRAKKSGKKCIGCPDGCSCKSGKEGCCGCEGSCGQEK